MNSGNYCLYEFTQTLTTPFSFMQLVSILVHSTVSLSPSIAGGPSLLCTTEDCDSKGTPHGGREMGEKTIEWARNSWTNPYRKPPYILGLGSLLCTCLTQRTMSNNMPVYGLFISLSPMYSVRSPLKYFILETPPATPMMKPMLTYNKVHSLSLGGCGVADEEVDELLCLSGMYYETKG